ncbi:PREDICTED: uncharacterized protein LOC109148685 [Ipomoea nil]|uniref:uncharacterized protein LOC109148685 n=1 Tax=Ipomoea nil TaxID=35883 RepID=UPI000901D611|nr:PREDICTED: uncharacterized protein LOC109148685 [Ipomoea nil]
MTKLGFDRKWINILYESSSTVRYHILHENQQLGPVVPGRGLRQGDPLSPYLSLLVVEGLSALIEKQVSSGLLHGVTVARVAPQISHLLFADDCFLFMCPNNAESFRMKWVLDAYSAALGQSTNFDKYIVCFSSNVMQQVRDDVVGVLGVAEGDTTGRYLGLPSLVRKNKKVILGFLKDKVLAKVRSWNARFLSRAGREVLLIIVRDPSYAIICNDGILLPVGLCKEIEIIMNEYW